MPQQNEIRVFFLKNPKSNILGVETYLKKRGFIVDSHTDLKIAVQVILETQPHYTLIAWDYPNSNIQQIPKIILQSVMTTIIPFCAINEKQFIRQLQICPYPHKIYPPMSGPAIQRLLSKLEKESDQLNDLSAKSETRKFEQASAQQIKSTFKKDEFDQILNSTSFSEQQKSNIYHDKGQRASELRNKTKSNSNSSNIYSLQQQESHQIHQYMNSYNPQQELSPFGNMQVQFISPLKDMIAAQTEQLSSVIKQNLNQQLKSQIEEQLLDLLETQKSIEQKEETVVSSRVDKVSTTNQVFCLVIQTQTRSGFLLTASELECESDNLKALLTNWVQEAFKEQSEEIDLDYGFIIPLPLVNFEHFSKEYAEYTQSVVTDSKTTILSLFRVDRNLLQLRLHQQLDMIEVLVKEVPVQLPVPFDLHLYLPENKKFILYCRQDSSMAALQMDRLHEKRINHLYTQLENEQMIQKYRAEKIIHLMIHDFISRSNKEVV